MSNKMPWAYRIAIIVIILVGLLFSFIAVYSVYRLITAFSIATESQSQANPAPDTIIDQVERIQRALKATGNPRYDCGPVDDIAGKRFRKAYQNYKNDYYYREIIKRMSTDANAKQDF